MRSSPFCVTSRPVIPNSGTFRRCGSPNERWSAALQRRLPVELLGRVLGGDLGVGGRIPLALVDAVEHADEPVAELEEDVVQAEAAAGRPELAGLGGAHRGDEVGEHQPALQEVHLPVPLELVPVVDLPRQPDVGHRLRREVALVARVVHRQHGGGRRREGARRPSVVRR